jgi:protein O-GlcNAc transferase
VDNAKLQDMLSRGMQRHQAGETAEAERLYQQVLVAVPGHPVALHLLGVIALQSGRAAEAVVRINGAIKAAPKQAEFHSSLGLALFAEGKLDAAVAAYQQAIALNAGLAQAHGNLGIALHKLGQLQQAAISYRRALELRPNWVQLHINLGTILQSQGKLDEAISAYLQAIIIEPRDATAHRNLSRVMRQTNRLDEAIHHCRQAISIDPNRADDFNTLGSALHAKSQLDEAAAAYQQALAIEPRLIDAINNLADIHKETGQVQLAIEQYQRALEIDPRQADVDSNRLYTMHFDSAYDSHALLREHKLWDARHAEPLRKLIKPHLNDRAPGRRLKIGYVSPDFRGHVVGWNMLPLLSHHDHKQFEIIGYSSVAAPDAVTARLQSQCDGWRNIYALNDEQAADLIRSDRIDILVDLSLHMAHNRLLVFARKPAAVQATYLGYCSTTGLAAMDYRLSDPLLDPPGGDESCYAERTVRLPSYWCYQPSESAPEIGPAPFHANGFVTFGCLNNFSKVSSEAMKLWAQVLAASPRSRLLIHCPQSAHRKHALQRLESAGIDTSRVEMIGMQAWADYIRTYHRIDIALDPFPYGGGITTCDALWMGVPIVTLRGRTAVGRGGSSILANIGLSELTAGEETEYVSIAAQAPRWIDLRPTLRQRMRASPLMDAKRFAGDVEAAFRGMWQSWTAS